MLLKRSIVLAAGVLLFIAVFITYFDLSHAQMEERFRAEREKFHVDQLALAPAVAATSTAASSAAPAASTPDTNVLSSPIPPTNSPVPVNTEPAIPAAPDPNSAPDTNPAPAMPSPSTMNYPRSGSSPFLVMASYRPSDGAVLPIATSVGALDTPAVSPVAAPVTNAAPSPAPSGGTNSESIPAPATTNSPNVPVPAPLEMAAPAPAETSVIVLLYHQFKPTGVPIPAKYQWTMNQDVFESEMKYIHDNGYHVIPMADLLKFLRHEITLPPGCVVITVDDGYKSAIVYAAPILKKYGYPWTYFIYPAFITTAEGSGAASWKDLLELQAEGIDIESHSMTHPHLTKKGGKTPEQYDAWLTNETSGSKAILEQRMGKTITCFAYPYGEYDKQIEAKVIAAGYEAIFTVADNPVHATTDLHSIGRYTITQGVLKNFPAYLRQSALSLSKAEPGPGATVSNPRPVITAVLEPMGAAKIDPNSIETQVRDFGEVRHDFDPRTNTVRLYLPRDLIQQVVLVNLRAKDATTGQVMVANWHFNYEPSGGPSALHAPLAPPPKLPSASTKSPASAPATSPAAISKPEPVAPEPLEKSAVGTPIDTHGTTPAPAAATNMPPVAPASGD